MVFLAGLLAFYNSYDNASAHCFVTPRHIAHRMEEDRLLEKEREGGKGRSRSSVANALMDGNAQCRYRAYLHWVEELPALCMRP